MDLISYLHKIHKIFDKFAIYDWIVVIVVLLIGLQISMIPIQDDFKPFIISYIDLPHRATTIPYENLCILIFGVGGLITILIWVLHESSLNATLSKCLAAYYFSISLTIFVESSLKQYVARPRPDTLSNCQITNNTSVSFKQCKQILSSYSASDQFLSFPSGHAAEAMASCLFISLLLAKFLQSKETQKVISYEPSTLSIQISNDNLSANPQKETDSISSLSLSLYVFFQFLPIAFALYVSFSRICDRAHHTDDVIMGLLIGAIISKLTFNSFDIGTKNKENNDPPM